MRILALSNIFPPGFVGGYELGAAELLQGLAARGHEVHVLTSNYLADDVGCVDDPGQGAPTVRRVLECSHPNRSPHELADRQWLGAFALPRNLRDVAGTLQRLKPDTVLCFNLAGLGAPTLLRLIAASGLRPVMVLMDNIFATACYEPGRKKAFEQAFSADCWPDLARMLFMSQGLKAEIESALGIVSRDSRIVPGWYHAAAEAPVAVRDDSLVRFVFASQLAGHKGLEIVLDASRRLLDCGCTDFVVDVFGKGEVAVTLQRITALGLARHVRYEGAPDKLDLMVRLRNYDALVFPTWHREPFGFIVAEAAVAGCIPIVSYGAGAAEWFMNGYDALKIERDPAALQAAMLEVAMMPAAARMAMRERAQSTARRFFRFDTVLDDVESALLLAPAGERQTPRRVEAALAILNEVWRARQHVPT